MLPVALLPVVLLLVVLPEEALLLCLCLPVVLVELLPVEQEVRLPVVQVVRLLLKNCVVIISGILPQKSLIQKIRKKNLKMMKKLRHQKLLQKRKHLHQKLVKKLHLLLKWEEQLHLLQLIWVPKLLLLHQLLRKYLKNSSLL
jgi:antitoxin component of RelBE/YafQ-DinJ toxin-antitoxin module